MNNIFDFSKVLLHCSTIFYAVAKGRTKTPKQQYEETAAILAEEVQKYEEMGERLQGMASGRKKLARIDALESALLKLEPTRYDDPLPQSAKSHLKRIYGEQKYGKCSIFKDKGNKYTNKGKVAEEDSIDLISRLDKTFYKKNEQRIENDYITGIPDVIVWDTPHKAHVVHDVKTSWDWDSFSDNIGSALNPLYWWQMQGYLALTDAPEGFVDYCLINCPDFLLEGEKFALAKRFNDIEGTSPEFLEAEKRLISSLTFDDIPPEQRRLRFQVKRDEVAIDKIYQVVPKCREYLAEIQEMHLTGFFTDKELPILDTIDEI